MNITWRNIGLFFIAIFLLSVILLRIRYSYYDVYLLGLDGEVKAIRKDIKEVMYITVSKEEHNLMHFWPKLQINVEVGDSVYKKPKEYNILLVKKKTKERFLCPYED